MEKKNTQTHDTLPAIPVLSDWTPHRLRSTQSSPKSILQKYRHDGAYKHHHGQTSTRKYGMATEFCHPSSQRTSAEGHNLSSSHGESQYKSAWSKHLTSHISTKILHIVILDSESHCVKLNWSYCFWAIASDIFEKSPCKFFFWRTGNTTSYQIFFCEISRESLSAFQYANLGEFS